MTTTLRSYLSLVLLAALGIGAFALALRIIDGSDNATLPRSAPTNDINKCIRAYAARVSETPANWASLSSAYGFCYHLEAAELVMTEQSIRNGNFVFQRYQNYVVLWMVVVVTVSGVLLAGLQLLASYRLAATGRGSLSDGGTVNLRPDNVVVNSSVIGVVILTISFAFFLVYVVYVYTIHEPGGTSTPIAPSRMIPPHAGTSSQTADTTRLDATVTTLPPGAALENAPETLAVSPSPPGTPPLPR